MGNPSSLNVVDVVAELGTDLEFVDMLARAEIVQLERDETGNARISREDAERLRLVRILTADLEVNLAGAEVILHMRERMLAMQRQMREILDAVALELRSRGFR